MLEYGAEGSNLIISEIPMENFGDTDPPITIEDIEQRSTLKRGVGGTSLRLDNKTRPKRLTINLMPGSSEARQLLALEKSGVDFTFSFSQTGSPEKVEGFEGIMVNRGSMGRAGKSTVSDDQFIFEFNDSEEV